MSAVTMSIILDARRWTLDSGPGSNQLYRSVSDQRPATHDQRPETSMRLPLILLAMTATVPHGQRARARDIGVKPGVFTPGKLNSITDVAGVRVGHATVVE